MRSIHVSEAQEGMILAKGIKSKNNTLVFGKDTVLTDSHIQLMRANLSGTRMIYIYDLNEIYSKLLTNSSLTTDYIAYTVGIVNKLLNESLNSTENFQEALKTIKYYLFSNRVLLFQLITLEDKHLYTYQHSLNVTMYSLLVGLTLGLTDEEIYTLLVGSIFHDIGKLKISNNILDKPSRLDESEYKAIQCHPLFGEAVLSRYGFVDKRITSIVRQHHEKLDGSGYPFGLTSNRIDYLSQIVTVCDMFDAIISSRSYHASRSIAETTSILLEDAGDGKLNKVLVDTLCNNVVVLVKNTYVVLSNGQSGFVMETCSNSRPKIMTYDKEIIDLSKRGDLTIVSYT